jgi:hypothetical protein
LAAIPRHRCALRALKSRYRLAIVSMSTTICCRHQARLGVDFDVVTTAQQVRA